MREEVEQVVKTDGWTKLAMQKMHKLDSFLKESQRYYGLGSSKSCFIYPQLITYPTKFLRNINSQYVSSRLEGLHLLRWNLHSPRDLRLRSGDAYALRQRVLLEW